MRLCARVWHFDDSFTLWVQFFVFLPIVEREAIDIVDESLRRCVVGQDQRMIFQFYMVVR